MAVARVDTMGIQPGRTKEMLPWARQIQDFEPQGAQGHTEETLWLLLCETLRPQGLRFLCPATTRAFCFVSTLQSLIRRALPAQPATAEAPLDRVLRIQDH